MRAPNNKETVSGDKKAAEVEGAERLAEGRDIPAGREQGKVSGDRVVGSSITLFGCGDRSGRDVWNAMSLAEAYRWVVLV